MQINKAICRATGDECFYTTLENGLSVYVSPNKKHTSSAILSVDFGSVNSNFVLSDNSELSLPDGMAHFLEHKMFETEDGGDAFDLFAQTGADANAFTSFTKTSYLFTCTDEFYTSLDILLHFVTTPHFTPESVEKEKGIIIQEIAMYDDHPLWQARGEMMKGLYRQDNPLITDIAGDARSVSTATDELLYSIHERFYDLHNMSLCVVGNVELDKVLDSCNRLPARPAREIPKTVFPTEERSSLEKYREKYMPVSRDVFSFGIKDLPLKDRYEMYRRSCAVAIITHALFSPSSEFYSRLYDSGIINNTFSAGYEYTECYALYAFFGETDRLRELYDELCGYIRDVKQNGVDEEAFELSRRSSYASCLRGLESSVRTCEEMSELYELVFETPQIISDITLQYAMQVFCEIFTEDAYTLAVIRPSEDKESK